MRVLAYDNYELFYDSWWEHKKNWGLKSHNGKVIFFRSSTSRFAKSAKLIRVDPLEPEEQEKYKLDLPFRTCRYKELKWTQTHFPSLLDFISHCRQLNIELSDSPAINTNQIILTPFGPTGGHKKSLQIVADNGKYFRECELLWKAQNVQADYKTFIDVGVGLFRLGLSKRLASYYIGGYYDLAESLPRQ